MLIFLWSQIYPALYVWRGMTWKSVIEEEQGAYTRTFHWKLWSLTFIYLSIWIEPDVHILLLFRFTHFFFRTFFFQNINEAWYCQTCWSSLPCFSTKPRRKCFIRFYESVLSSSSLKKNLQLWFVAMYMASQIKFYELSCYFTSTWSYIKPQTICQHLSGWSQ